MIMTHFVQFSWYPDDSITRSLSVAELRAGYNYSSPVAACYDSSTDGIVIGPGLTLDTLPTSQPGSAGLSFANILSKICILRYKNLSHTYIRRNGEFTGSINNSQGCCFWILTIFVCSPNPALSRCPLQNGFYLFLFIDYSHISDIIAELTLHAA